MANLKRVEINSQTVIDVSGNVILNEPSFLKAKDDSNIIDYDGKWMKSSIIHPGNSFTINISSEQDSCLDVNNTDIGNAYLKVNGVEIVNRNSIVNASVIEDKFLRNDSNDDTVGELTAQGGLVAGSSVNKIWVVKKVCDGILSSYTGATIGDNGEFLQFSSATPALYIPIDANPGSIITQIRCRFFTESEGYDVLVYTIKGQREDIEGSASETIEIRTLTADNVQVVDTNDIQDFTIEPNYKYWFEIKASPILNSVRIYSISYELSIRKY